MDEEELIALLIVVIYCANELGKRKERRSWVSTFLKCRDAKGAYSGQSVSISRITIII